MRKDAKIALCLILLLMVVVVVIWGRSPGPDEQLAVAPPTEPTAEVVASPPPPSPSPVAPQPTPLPQPQPTEPSDDLALEPQGPEPVGPEGILPPEPAMMNHLAGPDTATVEHRPEPLQPQPLRPESLQPQPPAITQQPSTPPETTQHPTPEPKPTTHIVVKGDNYIRLARKYYKDENKWRVIMEANKIPPEKLYVGQKLIIPPLGTTPPSKASATPPTTTAQPTPPTPAIPTKTYVVKKGESFYSIARKVYRDPTVWKKLYAHNRSRLPKPDDPASLMAGTIIELPKLASSH